MSGKSVDAGKSGYYLIRKNAVPEVLRKVVEVKHLLASGSAVGISRSTYYKYADDIEEFHDNSVGTTLTLVAEINDETGLLSEVLKVIAGGHANILTIHQSVPTNGVASLSISIQIRENTEDISSLIERMQALPGVRNVRITGRE